MNILNLFPTPVGFFNIGRDLTKGELSFITEQEKRPNTGNFTSVNNTLFESKKLKGLREFVESSISEFLTTVYAPRNDVKLRITQSWANYTETNQYHHKHAHPNSFVSGVFYVNADKSTDKIYFYNDGYQQIKLPTNNWNQYNSESWWFEIGSGDLILFPSSLTHMVMAVQAEKTRISIAFNTFPVGCVGDDQSLTGLYL